MGQCVWKKRKLVEDEQYNGYRNVGVYIYTIDYKYYGSYGSGGAVRIMFVVVGIR